MTSISRDEIPSMYQCAKVFVVPTGRDQRPCLEALGDCGVVLPAFPDDVDVVTRPDGYEVRRVKAKEAAISIADRSASAGVLGTDVLENLPSSIAGCLEYKAIGRPMGSLCLLGKAEEAKELRGRLLDGPDSDPVEFTSKLGFMAMRRVLELGLNAVLAEREIYGSEEASVGWKASATAAIVETGASMRAHNLEVLVNLADIYPAFVRAVPGTRYLSLANNAIVTILRQDRRRRGL